MSVIRTNNLTKIYHQGDTIINASKNINIIVEAGEMVAVTGKSGSGKTTLLNLLGAIDKPSSGTVFINDSNIYSSDDNELAIIRRRKIGFIFQNYNLIPILNAKENIIMPVLLDSRKLDQEYFQELTETLEIEDRLKNLPSELSGGQKQRIAIARALINRPSIILADEPTGNLDKKTADEIISLLISIHKKGHTIILVTHEEKYTDMCTRRIHISDGEIIIDEYL